MHTERQDIITSQRIDQTKMYYKNVEGPSWRHWRKMYIGKTWL